MAFTTGQVRTGGWLVTIYNAISYYDVDDPAFDEYPRDQDIQTLEPRRKRGEVRVDDDGAGRCRSRYRPRSWWTCSFYEQTELKTGHRN